MRHSDYTRFSSSFLLDTLGSIHDIEQIKKQQSNSHLSLSFFSSHWGHLCVIFLWLAGNLFHIGWSGNYLIWLSNPVIFTPISHVVWDPHVDQSASTFVANSSYSGIYNWLLSIGFVSNQQIYSASLALESLSLASIVLSIINETSLKRVFFKKYLGHTSTDTLSPLFGSSSVRLNFHIGSLFGFSSLLWSGHIAHVAIPSSRGANHFLRTDSYSSMITDISSGSWSSVYRFQDGASHLPGSQVDSGSGLLSFACFLCPSSSSIPLTDICHHHLAIGVLFLWSSHLYKSLWLHFGHSIRESQAASSTLDVLKWVNRSFHLQLSLALATLSSTVAYLAQVMYSCPSYPFIAMDTVTTISIYVHHIWIASLLMSGAFAHFSIFLIRDFEASLLTCSLINRMLSHKYSITSHLSFVTLWLGFHVLGLFVHNDTVTAFGETYRSICVEPVISNSISSLYIGHEYGNSLNLVGPFYGLPKVSSILGPSSSGDLLAAHAVSLGLHVSTLILIKGALDSRGSHLMPDKSVHGYGFSCDGPSRGGTCDISSWDAFYLSFFWILNTDSWLMFYTHWKYLSILQGLTSKFDDSSNSLNGWFRDYLWFNSSSLIRGYDLNGANSLSTFSWAFLLSHLVWATGFMFLISWRGYWQELVEIFVFMHTKTPFLYSIWDSQLSTPSALTIVQARFIGLVHFSSGLILTYASFVLGSSS